MVPVFLAADNTSNFMAPEILTVIKGTKIFLVENIRTARRFISSLNLGVAIEDLQFHELSKKTPSHEINRLLSPLKNGHDIGVMSESGCPGVADPGAAAAAGAHRMGARVAPLTGPSSILLALMASGLNGQNFTFHGYLPIDKNDRSKAARSLEKESQRQSRTQIFIETPYRNQQMFETLLQACQPETKLCIGVDITGKEEQIETHTISEWKKIKWELHKRPAVFLLQA